MHIRIGVTAMGVIFCLCFRLEAKDKYSMADTVFLSHFLMTCKIKFFAPSFT